MKTFLVCFKKQGGYQFAWQFGPFQAGSVHGALVLIADHFQTNQPFDLYELSLRASRSYDGEFKEFP